MRSSNDSFSNIGLFRLKDEKFLINQRIAGKVVAQTHLLLEKLLNNHSLIELDKIAENFILQNNCIPTFKGYRNYPNTCCMSVNNNLVHGIPSNYRLQEGDIIKIDLGATYNGSIADSATTYIIGTAKSELHKQLLKVTKEALDLAIKSVQVGKRIGCIGETIYKHVNNNGFKPILNYGGHGVCIDNGISILHAPPFISNKDSSNNGFRIEPGLVICIEPMITINDITTWVDKDGWSVYTKEVNTHEEHTLFIHENYVEIITDRN